MNDPLNEYIQSGNQAMIDAVNARIKSLEEKNQKLKESLRKYGQHHTACGSRSFIGCTCGWTATEKELI